MSVRFLLLWRRVQFSVQMTRLWVRQQRLVEGRGMWRSYDAATPSIDLDSNGGSSVFPFDIVGSPLLQEY